MPTEMEKIQKQFDFWRENPVEFFKAVWPGIKLWQKLEEIILSVRDNKMTVVPSCHGAGKSFISARVAIWWLFTHYPSKVITTAPTWSQVESVLWGELRSAIQKSAIPLCDSKDVLNTEIKLSPDWFAKGISTTEGVEQREFGSTKFQGFHSPALLVILDEAPGVHKSIHIAVETLTTGENNRILEIGNPTSPSGPFYNNCYSKNAHKIQISAFDHPNLKEGKEVISGAITKDWVERMKEEWGEGSPLYKAKVLGEFPDETEDTLIPLSWCEQAVDVIPNYSNNIKVLGVDPARFGDDRTVAYEIKGNEAKLKWQTTKENTVALSGRIVNCIDEYNEVDIDGTGVGGGVVDSTREQLNNSLEPNQRKGYKIREVHFGGKPLTPERFFNLKAEIFWNLRERLRPDGPEWNKLKIPDDDELKSELASIKFNYTSDGRIKLESKEELKERVGKSPDKADALAIASWAARPEKPEGIINNWLYKEFYENKRKSQNNVVNRLRNL